MKMNIRKTTETDVTKFAITPTGLKLLIAGTIVLIAGNILLLGGGSDDPEVFNYAMFDFQRLVAAPIVLITGLVVMVIGIMKR